MKNVIFAALIIALTGCGVIPPAKTNLQPENYSGEYGYIAGSIAGVTSGKNKNLNSFSTLFFVSDDESVKGEFKFSQSFIFEQERDFSSALNEGSVFWLRLPAGLYTIDGFDFYFNNGSVEKSYYSTEPLGIPFVVSPNETTYLGSFLAHGRYAKNVFGITIPAGGIFTWHDESSRDLQILKDKHPDFGEPKPNLLRLGSYFNGEEQTEN